MSADNRTVKTDALATLGTIIDDKQGRDAIHIAVEPAVAACTLRPGYHVGRMPDGRYGVKAEKWTGVVDPFLESQVYEGQRFWLFVYPRTITSLRHVWSHPDFPDEAVQSTAPRYTKEESEAWLRNFCDTGGAPSYELLMKGLRGEYIGPNNREYGGYYYFRNDGQYLHFNGYDACGSIPPEFWDHVEAVLGETVPQSDRAEYFSCSC